MNALKIPATAALLLLLATGAAFADDASMGVAPPQIVFAPDDLVARAQPQIRLDGRHVQLRLKLAVAGGPVHALGSVRMASFKWRGEGDPYPDRQYPELTVSLDARPARLHDSVKVETTKGDITGVLLATGLDPFLITGSPPVVDVDKLAPRQLQALRDAGALKADPDAGAMAIWAARREAWFDLPAKRSAMMELRYLARPAFALRSTKDAELDPIVQQACTSTARLREQAAHVFAVESVVAEEYVFDVGAVPEAIGAKVALDLHAAVDAPPTVYAACGPDDASLVGLGHLSATGVVGSDARVHVVALSVPARPTQR